MRKLCLPLGFILFTATAAQALGERGAWYTVKQLQPGGNGWRSSRSIQTFQRGPSLTPLATR
jgi:hypothetical protein